MVHRSTVVVSCALLALFLVSCRTPEPKKYTVAGDAFGAAEACFLLVDLDGRVRASRGGELCQRQVSPCSTFKIPNALLGLESGVIRNESEIIKWDGSNYSWDAWERDHDLQTAMRYSVVWYFQHLARRVGREKMQEFVNRVEYGNQDISGELDMFWIDSTLRISPEEQIDFLRRMYTGKLPVDPEVVEAVQAILVQARGDDWALSGKTGTCLLGGDRTRGWFVGFVESDEEQLVFATMMEGAKVRGVDAKQTTRRILEAAGLVGWVTPG